jgi:FKBP-type peptidyl-prolyl cis-trans isomerase
MRSMSASILWLIVLASSGCTKPAAPAKEGAAPPRTAEAPKAEAPKAEAPKLTEAERTPPPEAEKTASGLYSKVLQVGRGDARPEMHDKVRVNFTGWNEKGKQTDSPEKRGGPAEFELTGVVAGLAEGLTLMRLGETRKLWVPDALTYPGRPGFPRGNSVFEIELLEIIDGVPPQAAPADVAAVPADATKTKSGLAYEILTKGAGTDEPNPWDRVKIHYTGWTPDGAMFETSRSHERPAIFDLAKVMPGWREALTLLAVGDSARVWLPETLAYQGRGGHPRGNVVFDLELVSVERLPEPPRPPAELKAAPRSATRTKSGLAYRILHKGEGTAKPNVTDQVEVQYSAWTTDGKLFDSSVARGSPAKVPVDRLIPGWAEGLLLMAEGDKALFWIPEKLAYGGKGGAPKGMLVYEVELLAIVN